ncbi:alanine--tRNA ligase [Candidatus Dependentiae bacterium]
MNSFEVRKKFLNFFKKNGHTIVTSSSLIPAQDPTLLFTNAGMNQFKDIFLGKEKRKYTRATSSQKCVRAGGKHNDLNEVGFTNKHLTFFEMLGNFSFGDYFKEQAISYAWQVLTNEFKFDPKKLVITIYKNDDQSHEIWNKKIKIPKEKIIRLGKKDNFWQMGNTGPCGPCTEIHYDYGKDIGCKQKTCDPSCSCNRFVELWNLVFMQYNRQKNGELINLKQTGVDTGMGLERITMVLQKKDSIFHTNLFEPLIKKIEEISQLNYQESIEKIQTAFHVVCDHARSSSLLIADGAIPSNEGRGYVLRKIIRRAALFTQKITPNPKLFLSVANEFICFMSPIFPELKTNRDFILKTLENEIEKFATNLLQGKNILEKYIEQTLSKKENILSGKHIFKLYDTYGFPTEITQVIAKEKNLSLDIDGFEIEMKKQQEQSGKKSPKEKTGPQIPSDISTTFIGNEKLELETTINFISKDDSKLWISTKESPFYVESGGQASDKGWIKIKDQTYPIISFTKSDKNTNPAIAIQIKCTENIKIGDKIKCIVDSYSRINTEKNHTATHMLQAALVQILGQHIKQAGSFVNNKQLRFDFTHINGLTKKEIEEIENIVNIKIQEDIKLKIFLTTLEKAKEVGAKAFFGEKYNPEEVRVVQIPGFSVELCGGTHLNSTGQIGCFKIESEIALSSGIRRITAKTGPEAIRLFQKSFDLTKTLGDTFKVKAESIFSSIQKQTNDLNIAFSTIKRLRKQLWKNQIPTWQKQVSLTGKVPFIFLNLENIKSNQAKEIFENIQIKSPGFYFMICINPEKPNNINFFAHVSSKWQPQINLKEFSTFLKDKFEFRGGGSKQMIQGGGIKKEVNYKTEIENWVKQI